MNTHAQGSSSPRSGGLDGPSVGLGALFGCAVVLAASLFPSCARSEAGAGAPASASAVQVLAAFPPTSARDCAVRWVYAKAQDDYGQRALIASAVLNTAPAPDVAIDCEAPLLPSDVGGIPDPYRLQSARDAVDAIAGGTYDVPVACDGVTAFSPPEAAPRSQCVYGDLAFTTAEAR